MKIPRTNELDTRRCFALAEGCRRARRAARDTRGEPGVRPGTARSARAIAVQGFSIDIWDKWGYLSPFIPRL